MKELDECLQHPDLIKLNPFEELEAAVLLTALEDYVASDIASIEGKKLMQPRIEELIKKLGITDR